MAAWSRRGAALALAVSLALPGAATAASVPRGLLVLGGVGNRSVDVAFGAPVTVAPMLLAENGVANGWSATGCGGLRGFYLQPLAGDPMSGVGAVDLVALRFGRATDVGLPERTLERAPLPLGRRFLTGYDGLNAWPDDTTMTLPRGRYRVHLLGEGACEVRVPLLGYRGAVRRTVSRASAVMYGVAPLDVASGVVPAAPAPRAGLALFDVGVRSHTFAMALVHVVSWDHGVGLTGVNSWGACIAADPAPTCPVGGDRSKTYFHSVAHAYWTDTPAGLVETGVNEAADIVSWYEPGWLATGEQTARTNVVAVPATAAQGAMFALDLG